MTLAQSRHCGLARKLGWRIVTESRDDAGRAYLLARPCTICEEVQYRWEMLSTWRMRREIKRSIHERLKAGDVRARETSLSDEDFADHARRLKRAEERLAAAKASRIV